MEMADDQPSMLMNASLSTNTRQKTRWRTWQVEALQAMAAWQDGSFLLEAAPGAGKTRPAVEQARRLLAERAVTRVLLLCPTRPLTRQWAGVAARAGLQLAPDADSLRLPREFHGAAVTYARLASEPQAWRHSMSARTLVIADEAHHLAEELSWGAGFVRACEPASRWLLLSGTPFRSDQTAIPGVRYQDGLAQPDYTYGYAQAVADGVCRPVRFVIYDGALTWRSGEDTVEATFDTQLDPQENARRYRTAISTSLESGLPRLLQDADTQLSGLRADGHRDAGGLAVTADAEHARTVAMLLARITGRQPTLVLHTDADAAGKLTRFANGTDRWIVAVNMVSEGVDIPRLRVGVYASAAKTRLAFRQIIGRFVRVTPGGGVQPSWVHLPADPTLAHHARSIEADLQPVVREQEPGDPREREARSTPEPSEFQPLEAGLAPQMTLFGPPPSGQAASITPVTADPTPQIAPVVDQDEPPAVWEQREQLRCKRRELVAEISRREQVTHSHVNAWVNREVGVGTVREATVTQLQAAVRLLNRRLSRRRPARTR